MPNTPVPTAPMPVHTAYAVPTGRSFSASASPTILPAAATRNPTLGHSFEKPSDCFSRSAQTISSKPAARSNGQAIR